MKTRYFNIKVPAQCTVCGKVAESASLMHRIDFSTFKPEVLAEVQGKYLGQYVCDVFNDCGAALMKKDLTP